ncbi:hypothetical protein BDY24DRAFT_383134 [Mrakia frigida]|uniref:uncharacterized protein n=1 Tax=Mrakia frigida TaxID=29902 RepID=UPI003FCC20F9
MARLSHEEIELSSASPSQSTTDNSPSLSYYEPRRSRNATSTSSAPPPSSSSTSEATQPSSSIEPEDRYGNKLPLPSSSSSNPSPSLTIPLKRSRFKKLIDSTGGPRAGPRPLPVAAPLLTFAYTFHRSSSSFKPDVWLTRIWTSKLKRYGRRNPWKKGFMLGVFLCAWIVAFAFLVRQNSFLSRTEPSLGDGVSVLGCTSTFWSGNDGCGFDGGNCLSSGSLTFRCPGGCATQLIYNPRAIGNLLPDLVPLVIGGGEQPPIYRADSFICASAVHAGLISSANGGCGILNLLSDSTTPSISNTTYPSTDTPFSSIPFPTTFPNAFSFTPCKGYNCKDLRWQILGFHIGMAVFLGLFLDPPPLVWFWTLACLGFWNTILVTDQRDNPPIVSDAFEDFLPFLFVAYFFWRVAGRFTIPSFLSSAPIEAVIFSLGGFIPGMLLNIVSIKIPIDTLTDGAFEGDALGWVVGLIVAIVILVFVQIWWMWRTGWFRFYACWTVACGLVIVVLSQLPDLTFRLHHYIFAIMFVPALGFATRPSLALQFLLLGICCNGIGKFGFESILQTVAELQRDAALDTSIPTFITNSSTWGNFTDGAFVNSSLQWNAIPSELASSWNGFSLLVDDVERYVGSGTNSSFSALSPLFPHFFRLAYQLDGTSGGFTKAATYFPNGSWVDPLPGGT